MKAGVACLQKEEYHHHYHHLHQVCEQMNNEISEGRAKTEVEEVVVCIWMNTHQEGKECSCPKIVKQKIKKKKTKITEGWYNEGKRRHMQKYECCSDE